MLNKTNCGFGVHCGNREMQRQNHLLHTDAIKMYASTPNQLQELLWLTHTFSRDIKMAFGIEKCKTLYIAKGRMEMRNFTTEDGDTVGAMSDDGMYRHLGHVQAKHIKRA